MLCANASVLRFDYRLGKHLDHLRLLEQTILLSFLSFDLYKLFQPSLGSLFREPGSFEPRFRPLVQRLQTTNLFLTAVDDPQALARLAPELAELGKHLLVQRIESQKVYMEKLSFMVALVRHGDASRVRRFSAAKYVRFCIEVCILSLNFYNKSVFVTKMEESSLKLKSIVINKPKACEVEFPFVVVFDGASVNMILCVSRSLADIRRLAEESVSQPQQPQRGSRDLRELLKPKEKAPRPKVPSKAASIQTSTPAPPQLQPRSRSRASSAGNDPERTQEPLKKHQALKALVAKKEQVLFSLNKVCESLHDQTELLKMFVVKKKSAKVG